MKKKRNRIEGQPFYSILSFPINTNCFPSIERERYHLLSLFVFDFFGQTGRANCRTYEWSRFAQRKNAVSFPSSVSFQHPMHDPHHPTQSPNQQTNMFSLFNFFRNVNDEIKENARKNGRIRIASHSVFCTAPKCLFFLCEKKENLLCVIPRRTQDIQQSNINVRPLLWL